MKFALPAATFRSMTKPCCKWLLLILLTCPAGLSAQNPLEAIAEDVEREQMKRLNAQQKRPGIHITAFRSDGCSGGMSQSWSTLAESLPLFATYAGNQPPWEHCCVAHDRDYWRGETQNGFELREQSDARLRACVLETGQQRGAEIAEKLGLSQQEVVDMIQITGEVMYQAVRLGGAPCTSLPWRWGPGWPECSAPLEPGNQI